MKNALSAPRDGVIAAPFPEAGVQCDTRAAHVFCHAKEEVAR